MFRTFALVVAVMCGGVFLAPAPARAQQKDFTYQSKLTPQAPAVGTIYSLSVTFTNHSSQTIRFDVRVDSLPQGDQLQSANGLQQCVGPGQSYTFRFDIYCGVEGGTVRWSYGAKFVN